MDTFLVIASKREVRRYADRPIPSDVVTRILQAGRIAGSGGNRQPWRFHVLESADARRQAAKGVWEPANLTACALAVAIAIAGKGPIAFDAGRAAQNMMLAAANDGVGSCPNGVADADAFQALLDLRDGERVAIVLSFGYPAKGRDPSSRSAEEWIERADRKPLEELVVRH